MKKPFFILNLILLAMIIPLDICYMTIGGLWLKGLASSIFVLTGIVNLVYAIKNKADLKYPIWLVVGLVFGMAGDISLNLNFMVGAIVFAIGHVFYFVAYTMLQKFSIKDLIWSASIFVPSALIIILMPFLNYDPSMMMYLCIVYALVISCMVGKAASNFVKNKNITNLIILIGSILFFISDMMLLFNVFGGLKICDYFCLASYYPAQYLIAFSSFVFTNKK